MAGLRTAAAANPPSPASGAFDRGAGGFQAGRAEAARDVIDCVSVFEGRSAQVMATGATAAADAPALAQTPQDLAASRAAPDTEGG